MKIVAESTLPALPELPELLRRHQLRVTDARQDVLRSFLARGFAISHSELESALPAYDRVTLYRTLSTFEEHGLVHRVLDDGATKYALCAEACTDHHHADDHVHFKCQMCGLTECLDGVRVPAMGLPVGYAPAATNVLIQGRCPRCVA
jgi:Fur family transcriptional regulator, ferric uptake regulator